MNEEPKSIWKRTLTGKFKWLAWFVLVATAIFVGNLFVWLTAENNASLWELARVTLIIAVVGSLLLFLLIRVIRWLCCWRNFRRFLFGVACFVTLVAVFYAEEDWRGKRAWENHKRRWEAKGEKFTLAALAPPSVPDGQNFALTPVLKPASDFIHGTNGIHWLDSNGLARLQNLRADLWPNGSTNRTLALGSLEKGTFANLEACRDFYRGNTNYPQPVKPETAAADILVALGKFDPEIAELREAAATRPDSRFPIKYDDEPPWDILLPHLGHMRGLCILMQMRAIAELELGRTPAAFEDLKLGFRLSDSIREEPLLIDHLVRISTLGIDLQTLREGLVRHAWSEAQLAELEKYLASLNLLAEYKLAMRGERACSTGGLDWMRRGRIKVDTQYFTSEFGPRLAPLSLMPSGWFYQNMLTISELFENCYLPAVDEKAHRVFPDLAEKSDDALGQLRTGPYNIFAKLIMPALGRASKRAAWMQTCVDAARVACALERYRLANGKLPENLDALRPHFIEVIPTDVIDGRPLRYRLKPDGGYAIYSVGWNQTDDGGEVAWRKGKKQEKRGVDDTKGDWVWQMPGK